MDVVGVTMTEGVWCKCYGWAWNEGGVEGVAVVMAGDVTDLGEE